MSKSSLLSSIAVAIAIGVALHPAALQAQHASETANAVVAAQVVQTYTPASAASRDAVIAAPVGPRVAPSGIDTRASADASAPQDRGSAHLGAGANVALMGVGAAAVIVGLMIGGNGGTIVALAGGAVGLLGLFRYIR